MTSNPFMLTASGRDYVLGGPAATLGNAPEIKDIAHHLAQINRFTGACSRPYSVAEHSLLVERIGASLDASPVTRLALLLHDAHEAYTSDLASPAKHAVGLSWNSFESHHAANVRHYFGLRTTFASQRALITFCDLTALATERRDLMPYDPFENIAWDVLDTPGKEVLAWEAETIDPDEPPLTWREMRAAFLDRYLMLRELVQAQQQAQVSA
jgi:hypothetical protein